jgi:hypothetical protein
MTVVNFGSAEPHIQAIVRFCFLGLIAVGKSLMTGEIWDNDWENQESSDAKMCSGRESLLEGITPKDVWGP